MKVIQHPGELSHPQAPICGALGVFDGVHLGHRKVLHRMLEDAATYQARASVITFFPHPTRILCPDKAPPMIHSLDQNLQLLRELGIEIAIVFPFDQKFSEKSAETFIRELFRDVTHLRSLSVGDQFTFGHRKRGNVQLMETLGAEMGFAVNRIPAERLEGKIISSTAIRQHLQQGDIERASKLLGRPYSLIGKVIKGDGQGRALGFPTANLDTQGLALPHAGVYIASARVGDNRFPAAVNLGFRPTLTQPQTQLRLEAHLLDFHADLYHRPLEIIFHELLRPEQKFDSPEALIRQIERDVQAVRDRVDSGIGDQLNH